MNLQKESQLGAHAVMWASTNKPEEVRDLFKRNGIRFPYDPNNPSYVPTGSVLAALVTRALKMSKPFRADFVSMMAKYPEWATSYMSMNGEFANASGSVADTSLNLTTAIGTDAPKKNWFTADNIQSTLNTGLNAFLQLDKNKTDRALAGSAADVAKYNASVGKDSEGKPKDDTKSNTALYVVLGVVGVALVGGLVYFATKKR
jgi:hypothetical protein